MGFLGKDECLKEIAHADAAYLRGRKITHQQIADKLHTLLVKARMLSKHSQGMDAILEYKTFKLTGFHIATNGSQECPFGTTCGEGRQILVVENLKTHESLQFTDLHIHLIRDHHFFEGKGTSYRVDPEQAIKVLELELEPEVNYNKVVVKETKTWQESTFHTCPKRHREMLKSPIAHDANFSAYLMPTAVIEQDPPPPDKPKSLFKFIIPKVDGPPETGTFLHILFTHPLEKDLDIDVPGHPSLHIDRDDIGHRTFTIYKLKTHRTEETVLESGDHIE